MSFEKKLDMNVKVEECSFETVQKILAGKNVKIIHFKKEAITKEGNTAEQAKQLAEIDRLIEQHHIEEFGADTHIPKPVPQSVTDKIDFVEKGSLTVRVMDEHNFYEVESIPPEYLADAPTGLLTKLWISVSKATKDLTKQ